MVVALRQRCTIIVWAVTAHHGPVDDADVGCSMLLSHFFVSRLSLGCFLRCILDTTTIAAITKQLHKNAGGTPTNHQKRVPLLRQAITSHSVRSSHIAVRTINNCSGERRDQVAVNSSPATLKTLSVLPKLIKKSYT